MKTIVAKVNDSWNHDRIIETLKSYGRIRKIQIDGIYVTAEYKYSKDIPIALANIKEFSVKRKDDTVINFNHKKTLINVLENISSPDPRPEKPRTSDMFFLDSELSKTHSLQQLSIGQRYEFELQALKDVLRYVSEIEAYLEERDRKIYTIINLIK